MHGDPLAMPMGAIAVTPLVKRLRAFLTKQIWYADDATSDGTLRKLKNWGMAW